MTTWAIAVFCILLGLATAQAVLAWRFAAVLKRSAAKSADDASCPKAAVILCLRGSDPFLRACLTSVLNQDYPHYDLHIVVDRREDPGWAIAEQAAAAHGNSNVHMKPLAVPRPTCSLKCSSLIQVVSELDDSHKAIALLDADTIPHRTWLRELVAPLAEEHVVVATGNRWYVPTAVSWGGMVRRLWNAAAVVQMYWYRIPWGGTLALKLDFVRRSGLLQRWGNALCEDTMLYTAARQMGCRVAFVPSLMMVNREGCSLASFYRWVRRQLLTTRLYHPGWGMVVGHGLSTSVAQLTAVAVLGAAAIMGNGEAAAWIIAAIGLYWGIMLALLTAIESGVRHTVEPRGETLKGTRCADMPRALAAMAMTQVVYAAALFSAIFLRVVDWRGIQYRVDGSGGIRMIEYKPYSASPESRSTCESL